MPEVAPEYVKVMSGGTEARQLIYRLSEFENDRLL